MARSEMMAPMNERERDACNVQLSAFCPTYHRAIELIGRRWTGDSARCYRVRPASATSPRWCRGLSDRLLSERLKELEAEGIVVPSSPRPRYGWIALTEKGQALSEVIAVSTWGKWLAATPEATSLEIGRKE